MHPRTPAVIFGDHLSAFGAIRGLSRHGVPIYMVSKSGNGIATKSRFVQSVLHKRPSESDYLETLDKWLQREVGSEAVLIVAGDDDCLELLSQRSGELTCTVKNTFPCWETVQGVREKQQTYRHAEKLGIPILATKYVASKDELEHLLGSSNQNLQYPVFLKAEDSARLMKEQKTKGVICHDADEIRKAFDKCDEFYGNMLVQDFIPGHEEIISTVLMSVNCNSEPTGVAINRKLRSSGKFGGGTLVVSSWSDELLERSRKLVKAIGYEGYAGVQFKLDPRDGEFKLLEINGRISMSNSLALKCGVNLPYLMYLEATEGPLNPLGTIRRNYHDNVLWWYPLGDMISFLSNGMHRKPFAFLRSLIGRGYTIEPMAINDPLPGLYSLAKPFLGVWKRFIQPYIWPLAESHQDR